MLDKLLNGMVVGRPASTVDLPPVKIRTVRFQLPGWNRLRLREALLLKKGLTAMRSASSRGDRNAGAGLAYVARAQMLANAPITFQATPAAFEKHKNAIDAIDLTIASKYPEALTDDGALAEALEHIYGNLARSGVEVPIELGFRFQPPRIIDQVQQAGYSGAEQLNSSADESEEQTGYVPDLETITQKRLSEDYIHAEDTLETDRANNKAFDYLFVGHTQPLEDDTRIILSTATNAAESGELDTFYLGAGSLKKVRNPLRPEEPPKRHDKTNCLGYYTTLHRFQSKLHEEGLRAIMEPSRFDGIGGVYFPEGFEWDGGEWHLPMDHIKLSVPARENEDSSGLFTPHETQPSEEEIKTWKQKLEDAPDAKSWGPRSLAIADTISHIQRSYPDEKILVASKFLSFLDVIREATRRDERLAGTATFEYSGRSNDDAIEKFAASLGGSILLLSATAGGAGINIHYASHVILTEPFWEPGLEEQVIGRANRMPQHRQVYAYRIISDELAIDTYIMSQII